MLTVVCVCRSGGDFDRSWVAHLERSCFNLLPDFHQFVCLTDIEMEGPFIKTIPLEHGWKGWWSKIELFKPGLFEEGRSVIYFDLDTVITRNISHLFGAIDCDLLLLRDFYRPTTHRATGMMGWTAGQFTEIYLEFRQNAEMAMRKFRSDQEFIHWFVPPSGVRFWQDEFPGHVVSYKVHCQKSLPGDAHVVCFHGQPRPNSEQVRLQSPWMIEKWSRDA
jgi:hypothetical protein